jgi:hypothetical protein
MVITILIAVASPMSFSADNFEPYIKETTGSEVCELGLEKARKYFHSSEKTIPIFQHRLMLACLFQIK